MMELHISEQQAQTLADVLAYVQLGMGGAANDIAQIIGALNSAGFHWQFEDNPADSYIRVVPEDGLYFD